MSFNARSAWSIYRRELWRFLRTAFQSVLAPVLTTSLYFIVFGSAIGDRTCGFLTIDFSTHTPPKPSKTYEN